MKNIDKMNSSGSTPYKIVLLGDEGVGKTALLVRFLCRRYLGEYDPTIEDAYSKKVLLDGKTCVIEVLDTAETGNGTSRRKNFMTTANAFILVFSTIDSKSFQAVSNYKSIIEQYTRQHNIHIGLVGTKSDLTHLREVQRSEAQSFATSNGWTYSECSAAYDLNVQSLFQNAIRAGRGDKEPTNSRKLPDKHPHRKQSILNKLSTHFMRKRSCSKPVETTTDSLDNTYVNNNNSLAITKDVRQMTRRRSYSYTTMI